MKRKISFFMIVILICSIILPAANVDAALKMPAVKKNSPVDKNGRLKIKGNKIVNEKGKTFVIKGISTHGLSWYPEYVTKSTFKSLQTDFGANTIRLALYTADYNGYCTGDKNNQKLLKKRIDQGVKYATELGMYVIIDWHILSDGNPKTYQKESIKFFKEIAEKYKNYTNVIYEICNEPNGGEGTWKNIKSYSNAVIKQIRKIDKKAIIIVGTPTWSQDVDVANNDKISGSNIAYAFHFYADTHRADMRKKLENAIKDGLPVIVSEFGITSASGDGGVNKSEGNKWIKLLDKYSVGRVCWNLSNKNESSALLKASCTKVSGFKRSDLSAQGKWLVDVYKGKLKETSTTQKETTETTDKEDTTSVKLKAAGKLKNSWVQDNKNYYQYAITVKNTGQKKSAKWTMSVTFSKKPQFVQGWNGKYSRKGNTITIKSESYNGALKKNESTEIGFIVCSAKKNKIKKISITGS